MLRNIIDGLIGLVVMVLLMAFANYLYFFVLTGIPE